MAVWILLVFIAQFLNALVAIIDKYVVSSATVPRPITYAFYVTILSAFSVGVFLFSWIPIPLEGVSIPSLGNVDAPTLMILLISLLAGIVLFGALVSLFTALKQADASDVIPVVGACSAVGSLILSFFFLDATLTTNFFFGVLILVAGTFVLSHYRFGYRTLYLSIFAGLLFAAHFVGLKFLFSQTHFDDAFFWSRMGIVAAAFLAFLLPMCRKHLAVKKSNRVRAGMLIGSNKVLAGLASLMLLKAIDLGDVTVVQALGGLQFAFLLGFAVLFGQDLPQVCGEKCTRHELKHKTIGVAIIVIGFFILFL